MSPPDPAAGSPPLLAVMFDIGGVLVDWNPRHLYRKLFADPLAMECFLATICTPEWNAALDAGLPFAEGVGALVARHPEFAAEIGAYRDRWGEMLNGTIDGSLAVLAELREKRVPLFALTNWSAETFPIGRRRFAFLDWFDGIVVSGEERLRKPDPRIFCLAMQRFGLAPETTLFVDDAKRNVAAAGALGFRTHHFRGAAALREILVAGNLLPG